MIQARLGRIGGAGLSTGSTASAGGPTDGMTAFRRGRIGDRAGMDDLQIRGSTRIGGPQAPIEKHGLEIAGLGVVDTATENRDTKGPWRHGKMVSSKAQGVGRAGLGRFGSGFGGILTSDFHLSCL